MFGFALLLPVVALLATAHGSHGQLAVAAALLGLAAGCEMDVLTYVVSRSFPARMFGSVYSALNAGLSILASLGPLVASKVFDLTGTYDNYLWLAVVLDLVAVTAILTVLASWSGHQAVMEEVP